VIGLEKRKLAKKTEKEKVLAIYWQRGKLVHGTEAIGMLHNFTKKMLLPRQVAKLPIP